MDSRIVDRQESQRFRVIHPHRLRIVVKEQTISLLRGLKHKLAPPTVRYVPKNQDHPRKRATWAADRGSTVVNRNFAPIPRQKDRMICKSNNVAKLEHLRH